MDERSLYMHNPSSYEIEVFFDDDCPLCSRETAWLRRLDQNERILFTNIADPSFEPEGRTFDELMERIHGRLPDGSFIEGVEVFRALYAAVGFRRLAAVTRWPGLRHLLDGMYQLFARNRLLLTSRFCTAS